MGMVLDANTDWEEVGELLTESYCVHGPEAARRPGRSPPAPPIG